MRIATLVAAPAILLAGVAAVPAAAAPPTTAVSVPPAVVSGCHCWGGYVDQGSQYHSVTAVWQVPSIPAEPGGWKGVAFWVGLGGYGYFSGLEQIGTSDVTQDGKVYYIPWWEVLPWNYPTPVPPSDKPHNLPYSVKPGDFITASVALSGNTYYLAMSDNRGSNNTIWSVDIPVSVEFGLDHNSAEVILESGNGVPLPDFGQIFFDGVYIDGQPLGNTNPTYVVLGANPQKIYIHPIGPNGDNFVISWVNGM